MKPKKEPTIEERVEQLEKTLKLYGIILAEFRDRVAIVEDKLKKKNET